jgi:hypothetical protein
MSNDPHSRARKVFTSLEGADEFSVMSVEPDIQQLKLELQGKREALKTQQESVPVGVFTKLIRRFFRG